MVHVASGYAHTWACVYKSQRRALRPYCFEKESLYNSPFQLGQQIGQVSFQDRPVSTA